MRNKIYGLLLLPGLLFCIPSFAQDAAKPESLMRSNGKIFVVIAILLTILSGLFLYILSIDKKISKIEKEGTQL